MRASILTVITLSFAASLMAQQVYDPSDLQRVSLIDAGRSLEMQAITASHKGSWSVVVSQQYFVFKGPRAALRTKTSLPEFQFEMDPAFDTPVSLFKLDVHSDRRQIRVARSTGGLTPISLPKDHVMKTTIEEIGSGQDSMKRYRLKPAAPLAPGEYCLSRSISTCYDFGID